MRQLTITPQFVELIPTQIQDGILYISEKYGTAIHKCCCGCGHEVVTPLSLASWKLYRVGNIVTLHPSIGNWKFQCKSHYLIQKNKVIWVPSMSKQQIHRVQDRDKRDMERYIAQSNVHKMKGELVQSTDTRVEERPMVGARSRSPWHWLKTWWEN